MYSQKFYRTLDAVAVRFADRHKLDRLDGSVHLAIRTALQGRPKLKSAYRAALIEALGSRAPRVS